METRIDPWKDLTPPSNNAALSARRVDAESPWDFFWARGIDKRCILALKHSTEASIGCHLPMLKGIECVLSPEEAGGKRVLSLKLLDSSLQDIFYRLCLDIVAAASDAKTELEVVARTVARTWRWHHLLRGGGDKRLSPEEQKGLIGELIVFEKFLLSSLTARDAVASWHGPLGAPKDFEIGQIAVEAKARRGAATPYVAITSEHQLDRSGTDALFLHVSDLSKAVAGSEGAFTLTTIVERTSTVIRQQDHASADAFESLLGAAGFRREDDYSDSLWVHGLDRAYHVTEHFPSITPEQFGAGVSMVHYSISLSDCESFRVVDAVILANISGGKCGD